MLANPIETCQSLLGFGEQVAESRKARKRRERSLRHRKFAYLQFNIPGSAIAAVATTAKTMLSAQAAANQPIKIIEQTFSFDGATSTNTPALVESGRCTFGAAGTGTSVTPSKQDPGRAETIQTTALKAYSAEPTTISAVNTRYCPVYNGTLIVMTPDSRPWVVVGGQGWVVRVTAPANVNFTGDLACEE